MSHNKGGSNTKTKKDSEDLDKLNVEDLLNEEDDDDDDDDDEEDMQSFYKQMDSIGQNKYAAYNSSAIGGSSSIGSSAISTNLPQDQGKNILASGQLLANVQLKNQQIDASIRSSGTMASSIAQASAQTAQQVQQQYDQQRQNQKKYLDDLLSSSDEEDEEFNQIIKGSGVSTKGGQTSSVEGNYEKTTTGSLNFDKKSQQDDSDHSNTESSRKSLFSESKPGDVIDLIEKNEKMNEMGGGQSGGGLEHASQLLSFDNKFYNIQKKLVQYSDFPQIAKKLHFVKDHQYSGIVSAIAMFQNYLFAGNSSGIIRVFDMKTQKEMKPLLDSAVGSNNKVTCMEIAEDGGFLLSGYKKGQIALWDLVKYKLLKFIPDFHQSEVVSCKLYYMNEEESLFAVSSEDTGAVNQIEFTKKNFLGGYSYTSQFLFKTRLKGTATISLHTKNKIYPHKYCDNSSLVAFGSLNEIVVCSMRPIKEVLQISKPTFCKEKSLPYIDWGYGLTPGQRDKTVPIMAFAWDKLIQLVYINEQSQTIQMDGFYYSDQEIQSLHFVGESILFALINGKEVKVLYTTKFYPGHFRYLENVRTDDLINNQFEKVISVTAHCELEKGYEVPDIKSTVLQCQSVMNFNQCVKKYKHNIFFMGNKTVVQGHLFSWKQYLEHIKFKENCDWLTVLKVALEIYNGESKGYARVPDEKEAREEKLKTFMQDMIKDSVQTVIYKFNQKGGSNNSGKEEVKTIESSTAGTGDGDGFQAESIAIKVAIEFCLSINAIYYLFHEIFQIFVDNGLERQFILNLEPFIVAGQFKKEIIPEGIVRKMIKHYEEKNDLKKLEKIIQQLNFSEYSRKDELLVICQSHCMVSALLYLMTVHSDDELGCMQILNTMFKLMRKAKNQDYKKADIFQLSYVDSQKKYDIEKSQAYIGYKLLWIIKMFLDGKSFPMGALSVEKHRIHVYDIAHFVTTEEFVNELISFDCEEFLRVIAKLFYGQPYQFLATQKEFYAREQARAGANQQVHYPMICPPANKIIEMFSKKCSQKPEDLDSFNRFLLQIQSMTLSSNQPSKANTNNQDPNQQQQQQTQQSALNLAPIELGYDMIIQAVMSEIKKKGGVAIDEDVIIATLKSKKIEKQDVDKLLALLDQSTQSLIQLRIFLLEKKKDFVQSFRLNLMNQALRKNIFSWIHSRMETLEQEGDSQKQFLELKNAIQVSMRDLIAISDHESIAVIDRWFDEYYQEQLILKELADNQTIQFKYLQKFLNQNEEKIKQTILESAYKKDQEENAAKYLAYLVLHTQLLCRLDRSEVERYVSKDYYPINECLQVCIQNSEKRGEAVLHERNGKHLVAIQTYLAIIGSLDLLPIHNDLARIAKSVQQQQAKQGAGGMSNSNKSVGQMKSTAIAGARKKWDYLQCREYKHLHEFDQLVERACDIAQDRKEILAEEGWFAILDGLVNYMLQLNERAKSIDKIDTPSLDRIKDFVYQRKNAVLKMMPSEIPLSIIMDKLKLDFIQMKKLYDYKVEQCKIEEKFSKIAKSIIIHDVNEVSRVLRQVIAHGFNQRQQERCAACGNMISLSIQKLPFRIYPCRHVFHENCILTGALAVENRNGDLEPCPLCKKKTIAIGPNKNEQKRRGGIHDGRQEVDRAKDLKKNASQSNDTEASSGAEDKAPSQARSQGLYIRQLEAFDNQLDLSSLKRSNFG